MATQSKNNSATMAPTENEIYKLENALKDGEFRRLLCDYAKEVNHPENKARYESEVVQMELERGFECTFLHPNPGYVLKTANLRTDEKVFVNVCSDPAVGAPVSRREDADKAVKGVQWSIPYFQSQPRKDVDKGGRPCTVYDVIFHPTAVAFKNPRLRALVVDTALEAVEKAFDVKLEHDNLRFPKMKVKGAFHPTVIRRPLRGEVESDEGVEGDRIPEYVVKFRHRMDDLQSGDLSRSGGRVDDPCRPSDIVVEILLSEMTSTKGVELDITETRLTLESAEPVAYALTVPFPYPVVEEKATAKFDKTTRKLSVSVPVRPDLEIKRLVSTDSGIDVDTGYFEEQQQQMAKKEVEKETPKVVADQEDLMFPSYSCNIYEDLMIFTLDVKNVDEASLVKSSMPDEPFGFSVKFSSVGAGCVPFNFGFYCALVLLKQPFSPLRDPAGCVDVEIWDNNVIVKVSLPRGVDCEQYKVGSNPRDLTIHSLPQLRALRKRKEKLMKKSEEESSLSFGDDDAFEAPPTAALSDENKDRHSSGGDSDDSTISEDVGSELKGILKQRKQRCFSESQTDLLSWNSKSISRSSGILEEEEEDEEEVRKSVRFSEVVQRHVFRPTSSILGQTQKNLKKKQAKQRRAERRASEGDAEEHKEPKEEEEEPEQHEDEEEHNNDSGVASSVDEGEPVGRGKGKKRKGRKAQQKFWSESTNDLMFDLDI